MKFKFKLMKLKSAKNPSKSNQNFVMHPDAIYTTIIQNLQAYNEQTFEKKLIYEY